MKKSNLAILMTLVASSVFAQAPGTPAPGTQPKGDRPTARIEVTVTGTLVFVDDRPAIKAADGKTVFLEMPRFYYYAYTEGFKAGIPVKARGVLLSAPEGSGNPAQDVLAAGEVTIGGKTYVIVGGPQGMGRGPDSRPPMGPLPSGSDPSSSGPAKR